MMQPDKIRALILGLDDPIGHKSYYPELQARLEEVEASKARLEEKSAALQNILADLEQAQVSIRESEERFRRLAENAVDVIFRLKSSIPVAFEYVSPAAERFTGYSPIEFYNDVDLIERLVHPDDHALIGAMQQGLLPSGTPVVMRWVHKDGATIWVEMRHALVYDDNDELTAIEGIARDITERKAADEALRQRTQEVSLLYEAGRQLSSTLDLRRVYTTFYQMAARAMDCDGLLVSSYSPEENLIRCVYGIHEGQELDVSSFPPLPLEPEGRGLQSEVIRRGEPLVVADYISRNKTTQSVYRYDANGILDEDEIPPEADEVRSALITPLKLDGVVVGVVQVFSFRFNAYTSEQLRFLDALALLTAAAAHNARLYAQAQQEVAERRRAEDAYKHAVAETQNLNRRLSILYEIGLALAQAVDLKQVYRAAYEHVLRLADCPYFAISHYDAPKRTLYMHFAMVDGVETDTAEFPPFTFSENIAPRGRGKALLSGQPLLLSDLAERVKADVQSGRGKLVGSGPIPDSAFYIPLISASQVIGLMELQSYQNNAYNQDQVALLGATANQIALAIERAGLYEQMRASLGEKEVLLREVHHRVKNNLEVVISLAELQSRSLSDPAALSSLRDFQARVRTIALVHENLYLSTSIASIRADIFLNRLVDSLVQAFGPAGVTLRVVSDESALSVEKATPLGLIVTELTTNAIKHAFPDVLGANGGRHLDQRPGPGGDVQPRPTYSVQIDFRRVGEALVLEVCDNGIGLPPGLDWRTARSLGLRLVNRLAGQIYGELEVESGAGTCFRLTFPVGEADE